MTLHKINLKAKISEKLANQRLDQALVNLFPDYSRERLKKWIKQKQCLVNGYIWQQPKDKVLGGEFIQIQATLEIEAGWSQAEPIALNIIYEDDTIIIINKHIGFVVHPGAGNHKGTLVNALLHHDPALRHIPRAGIVHRLDKDTSGVIMIVRSLDYHNKIVQAIDKKEVKRDYLALVHGHMISGGTIDQPIGRHPHNRLKMSIQENGKKSITHYRVLKRFLKYTLLSVQLETGRTHQIRVHMAHNGFPLVGDKLYGGMRIPLQKFCPSLQRSLKDFKRQALHAHRLTIIHPKTGKLMTWEAPVPEDMQYLLNELERTFI